MKKFILLTLILVLIISGLIVLRGLIAINSINSNLPEPYLTSAENINVVPEELKLAVLATEDQKFYIHNGYDLYTISYCTRLYLTDRGECGASTITQQVARNNSFSESDYRNRYERKIAEILLAKKYEQEYSKDEILSEYIFTLPMGANAYGIDEGAKKFLEKDLDKLTTEDIIFLVALIPAPSIYNPQINESEYAEELLNQRKKYVSNQLADFKITIDNNPGLAGNLD